MAGEIDEKNLSLLDDEENDGYYGIHAQGTEVERGNLRPVRELVNVLLFDGRLYAGRRRYRRGGS